jgi:hypothetical protein
VILKTSMASTPEVYCEGVIAWRPPSVEQILEYEAWHEKRERQ